MIVRAPGKGVTLSRLIVRHHEERRLQCRQQLAHLADTLDHFGTGGRVAHLHGNKGTQQFQLPLLLVVAAGLQGR